MGNKIFNKKLPRACGYCLYSHAFDSQSQVICIKRGVVGKNDSCRKYSYDVTKRVPVKKIISGDYTAEDFKI